MDIEQEIIKAGANSAPRVTPEDIEASIVRENYFTAADGAFGSIFACGNPRLPVNEVEFGDQVNAIPGVLHLLTFCVLTLRNGFTVTGESACVSLENFNEEIGRKVARNNAIQKMWPLLGYALKEQLAS